MVLASAPSQCPQGPVSGETPVLRFGRRPGTLVAVDPERAAAWTRGDLARALRTSERTIARHAASLGLDDARVEVSRRTIRYSVTRLQTREWFLRLTR